MTFVNDIKFKSDVQQNDGTFDGIIDTVHYNPDTKTFSYTDGATGKSKTIDVKNALHGTTAYTRLDFDGDGASDQFVVLESKKQRPQSANSDGMIEVSNHSLLFEASSLTAKGKAKPYRQNGNIGARVNAPVNLEEFKTGQTLLNQGGGADGTVVAIPLDVDGGKRAQKKAAKKLLQSGEIYSATPILQSYPKADTGDWGFDLQTRDLSIKAGDDFFTHANGAWLKSTSIPADKEKVSIFNTLQDKTNKQIHNIIQGLITQENTPGSIGEKIGNYYKAYMDTETINTVGLKPFQADLNAIQSINTYSELAHAFGQGYRKEWSGGLGAYVSVDAKQPNQHAIHIGLTYPGFGSRDNYLEEGSHYDDIRAAYQHYMEGALEYAGYTAEDAKTKAKDVMALHTNMAQVWWSDEYYWNNPNAKYNPTTLNELKTNHPDFDWDAMLLGAGLEGHSRYIAEELSGFAGMIQVIKSTPLDTWKAMMTIEYLGANANVLPQDFQDMDQKRFNGPVYGTTPRKRSELAIENINFNFGEGVGKYYVEKHFDQNTKHDAQDIYNIVKSVYTDVLTNNTWMSADTKTQAINKLDAMMSKIGYPEKYIDFSSLDIEPNDAAGNRHRFNDYYYDRMNNLAGKPVDRSLWGMLPQQVNAGYSRAGNSVTLPAAYLQPPFYDINADDAVKFGILGCTAGHEIGHGFDAVGAQYDSEGALQNWWTESDWEKFESKTQPLDDQFDQLIALPETIDDEGKTTPAQHVNGELTLTENIGDLIGLEIAYKAYKKSLNGEEAPIINGLTGDQRFFYAYALSLRSKGRDSYIREKIISDVHAPHIFRVNAVRNFEPWYKAFDVQPGDELYLPPEERVKIW